MSAVAAMSQAPASRAFHLHHREGTIVGAGGDTVLIVVGRDLTLQLRDLPIVVALDAVHDGLPFVAEAVAAVEKEAQHARPTEMRGPEHAVHAELPPKLLQERVPR